MLELAQLKDRDAVERLAQQVHAMHVSWRPDIYEMVDELYSEERFQRVVSEKQLFAAKAGERLIGYVLLVIHEYNWPGVVRRKVMTVDEICVDEALRGHGIGTRMMEEVKLLARAFGCTDLQLGVYPQNDEAVSFYQKCGFTIRNINMQMKL